MKAIMDIGKYSLPAHPGIAVARPGDFIDRVAGTIGRAFHAAAAFIEINPGFVRRIFAYDRIVRTIYFHQARFAVYAVFRINNSPFHNKHSFNNLYGIYV